MKTLTSSRTYGGLLSAAALLIAVAMTHHPRSTDSMTHSAAFGGDLVHGLMILLVWVVMLGVTGLCLRLDMRRPLVMAGWLATLLATVFHTSAALVNGFVVPALATSELSTDHDLFLVLWETNQAMARLGVYAASVALLTWGWVLARTPGWPQRSLGTLGLVIGFLVAAALATAHLQMDLQGAQIVYAAHGLWYLAAGAWLILAR